MTVEIKNEERGIVTNDDEGKKKTSDLICIAFYGIACRTCRNGNDCSGRRSR